MLSMSASLRVVVAAMAAVMMSAPEAQASRFYQTLDDFTTVVAVDNVSAMTNTQVGNLVLAADRSTQDDGMWARVNYTGLMSPGDRLFVNDNYMAWLRSSYLLGVWTISNGTFANTKTGPEGFSNWAHNEMVMGSASPSGEVWHWDANPMGIEHSVAIPNGGSVFLATHHYGLVAPNGAGAVIYDGQDTPLPQLDGNTYASGARLAGVGSLSVDAADFTDGNGIQNYIESQLAFVMRPNDIKVVWRFKPFSASITPSLVYYWNWASYSFDMDGYGCFPGTGSPNQTWGQPSVVRSSRPSHVGNASPQTANTLYSVNPGTRCDGNANIRYADGPAHGDYIEWGESATLATGTPQWRITLQSPSSDLGTAVTPTYLAFGNESQDGVWGGGGVICNDASCGLITDPVSFGTASWYVQTYTLKTK